jgi:hypothetical protein
MMSDWPKHADGRNKKVGEMTPEELREMADQLERQAKSLRETADDMSAP